MINEALWHDERRTFRAVTGVTSTLPNADGTITRAVLATAGTIPRARTFTGTFSSTGVNVLGVGTLFITNGIKVGDFLYNSAGEIRMIKEILTELQLILDQAFTSNQSTVAVKVCERQTFKMITAESTGTGPAILQEVIFPVGSRVVNGGAPLVYDASGSNGQISFTISQ